MFTAIRNTGFAWAAAFLLLLGFYTLTNPRNHSEANDALGYALTVEQTPAAQLWHSQHLLYFPVAKLLFVGAQKTGLADRANPVLMGFSRVCGALTVLAVFLLLRTIGYKLDYSDVAWPPAWHPTESTGPIRILTPWLLRQPTTRE